MAKVYNDKRSYLDNRLQFQNLSRNAGAILKPYGIRLTFEGLVNTMVGYMRADEMTPTPELEEMIRDLNCWVDYLGEVRVLVSYYKEFFEIIGDSTPDENKMKDSKNKAYVLKKYESAIYHQEKTFIKAYKDLEFQYHERVKKYMRFTGDE